MHMREDLEQAIWSQRACNGMFICMQELANGCYILGIIALVMNALSFLFAVFFGIRCLCGRVGRGFICFSIPFRSVLSTRQVIKRRHAHLGNPRVIYHLNTIS